MKRTCPAQVCEREDGKVYNMSKMTRPRKKPRGRKDSEKALVRGRGKRVGEGQEKEDMGFQQAAP